MKICVQWNNLPYFFPDTFHEGGDPEKEAKVNWVTARRAILRSPIQRIGNGEYLKLALQLPDFVQYIKEVCQEFGGEYWCQEKIITAVKEFVCFF